jgi:hypothetical protein
MSKEAKEIELTEITEGKQPVGTEIFDPTLPSNIDFEDHPPSQPLSHQPLPSLAKVLTIGD